MPDKFSTPAINDFAAEYIKLDSNEKASLLDRAIAAIFFAEEAEEDQELKKEGLERVSVCLECELLRKLERYAGGKGVPEGQVIREALKSYLEQRD